MKNKQLANQSIIIVRSHVILIGLKIDLTEKTTQPRMIDSDRSLWLTRPRSITGLTQTARNYIILSLNLRYARDKLELTRRRPDRTWSKWAVRWLETLPVIFRFETRVRPRILRLKLLGKFGLKGYVCGGVRYCACPCRRVPFRDASRNVLQGFQSAKCSSLMLTPQIACSEYSTWLDTSHSTSRTDTYLQEVEIEFNMYLFKSNLIINLCYLKPVVKKT